MRWNDIAIEYTRNFMRENGLNQAQFCKKYCITESALSKMLRGGQDKIEEPTISGMCKAFNLNKRQLEDMIEGTPGQVREPRARYGSLDHSLMPFFSWLSEQDTPTQDTFLSLWQTMRTLATSGNSPPPQETQRKRVG